MPNDMSVKHACCPHCGGSLNVDGSVSRRWSIAYTNEYYVSTSPYHGSWHSSEGSEPIGCLKKSDAEKRLADFKERHKGDRSRKDPHLRMDA